MKNLKTYEDYLIESTKYSDEIKKCKSMSDDDLEKYVDAMDIDKKIDIVKTYNMYAGKAYYKQRGGALDMQVLSILS